MNVLIVVTHLLGSGHLRRALTLAKAFAAQGHDATLVSGGVPVPQFDSAGVSLVQLPALRSDGVNFTNLLTADAAPASDNYLSDRRHALTATLIDTRPDVLITELYPFGRRVLRTEFLALLDAAKSMAQRPLVLSSIRDILAPPSKPERAQAADAIIAQYYDGVLVHSDAHSTPLDQSWPVSDLLRPKLHYTGYVTPPPSGPHPVNCGKNEVLVSAGGGSVGNMLFETALKAAHMSKDRIWRLLVGGSDANVRITRLKTAASSNVIIEPARPDFRQMLYHAACSVSMCGYNTALDILQSGVPSVLVPFDDGGEVEQTLRAQSLTAMAGIEMIRSDALSPEKLLFSITAAQHARRPEGAGLQMDGAAETVRVTRNMSKLIR